jgi:hypothetical protein
MNQVEVRRKEKTVGLICVLSLTDTMFLDGCPRKRCVGGVEPGFFDEGHLRSHRPDLSRSPFPYFELLRYEGAVER